MGERVRGSIRLRSDDDDESNSFLQSEGRLNAFARVVVYVKVRCEGRINAFARVVVNVMNVNERRSSRLVCDVRGPAIAHSSRSRVGVTSCSDDAAFKS